MNGGKQRRALHKQQNGLCFYCLEEIKDPLKGVLEHAIPKSAGGTVIVLSCKQCDILKGSIRSPKDALLHCQKIMRIFDRMVEAGIVDWHGNPGPTHQEYDPPFVPAPIPPAPELKITNPHNEPTMPRKIFSAPGRMYDWLPGERWGRLQVKNPDKDAWPVMRVFSKPGSPEDPLCKLLRDGLLEGQALEDAKQICVPTVQVAVQVEDDW